MDFLRILSFYGYTVIWVINKLNQNRWIAHYSYHTYSDTHAAKHANKDGNSYVQVYMYVHIPIENSTHVVYTDILTPLFSLLPWRCVKLSFVLPPDQLPLSLPR